MCIATKSIGRTNTIENLIPKKIHYVWMGGADKSELALRCIESWKKYMPDYEIIEWNESNFDINMIDYTREAYEQKKWASVPCDVDLLYKACVSLISDKEKRVQVGVNAVEKSRIFSSQEMAAKYCSLY